MKPLLRFFGTLALLASRGAQAAAIPDPTTALKLKFEADQLFTKNHSWGSAERALSLINEAIFLAPSFAWQHYDRGRYQSFLGMHDEAIASFTKELEINNYTNEQEKFDARARSYFERGFSYQNIGALREAASDFRTVLEQYPTENLVNLCEEKLRVLNDEIEYLKRMESLDLRIGDVTSRKAEAIKLLSQLAQERGGAHFASVYKEMTSVDSVDYFTHLNLEEPGKFHLERYYTHYKSGLSSLKSRDYEKAIGSFDNQVNTRFLTLDIFNLRGLANLSLNRSKEAVFDFDEAILETDRSDALHNITDRRSSQWFRNNRGIAYTNLGLFEEAIADFSEELKYNPNSESYWRRGVLNKVLGHEKEAAEDFAAAREWNWYLIAAAVTAGIIFLTTRVAAGRENADAFLQQPRVDSFYREDGEAEIAIRSFARNILEINHLDEDTSHLAQIPSEKLKEICDSLCKMNKTEEIREFLTDNHEAISKQGLDFLKSSWQIILETKQTRRITRTSGENIEQNFVYNNALKPDKQVGKLDPERLRKYLEIFEDEAAKYILQLHSEAVRSEVATTLNNLTKEVEERNPTAAPNVAERIPTKVTPHNSREID